MNHVILSTTIFGTIHCAIINNGYTLGHVKGMPLSSVKVIIERSWFGLSNKMNVIDVYVRGLFELKKNYEQIV